MLLIDPAFRQTHVEYLFDKAPYGCALLALDGRWLKVNAALTQIVGYTESELLERTFQSMTHPDDVAPEVEMLGKLQRSALPADFFQMYKRFIHKLSGRSIPIVLTARPVRNEQGLAMHYLSVIQTLPNETFGPARMSADAAIELRPITTPAEFVRRHWKWLLGGIATLVIAAAPAFWTAGRYLVASHYEQQKLKHMVLELRQTLVELQSQPSD